MTEFMPGDAVQFDGRLWRIDRTSDAGDHVRIVSIDARDAEASHRSASPMPSYWARTDDLTLVVA
jgi:hypothetical protein